MTLKDKLSKLYNEYYQNHKIQKLLNNYKKGGFEKISKNLHKYDIYTYSSLIDTDLPLYNIISSSIYEYILNKLKTKDKINIGFVVHSASMWSCEELYRYFENDPRFNPYVIVSRCNSDANLKSYPLYFKALEYFKNKNYNIKTLNTKDNRFTCWIKMGKPDILVYLSPYNIFTPKEVNLKYMPADVLTVYIPYCYRIVGLETYRNQPGIMYTWKHFVESSIYIDIISNDKPYRKNHLFSLGYPKMDYFRKESFNDSMWKDEGNRNKKRIIYAPHHSIGWFSTFKDNGKIILSLAKKYKDSTCWIVKPHPLLGFGTIRSGVFKNNEEYENYLNEWRSLDNADVIEESTYEDLFMTSDAMIFDSISFMAEYQFTHKPPIFLQNKDKSEYKLDEFGSRVFDLLYKVPGTDTNKIEEYLMDIIINGNDPMKNQREEFFVNYLENKSDKSSSYQIYKNIKDSII